MYVLVSFQGQGDFVVLCHVGYWLLLHGTVDSDDVVQQFPGTMFLPPVGPIKFILAMQFLQCQCLRTRAVNLSKGITDFVNPCINTFTVLVIQISCHFDDAIYHDQIMTFVRSNYQ
jgi:hypothetical protein